MRFAVIGCGRSGSLVATALNRLGIQELTVIDPDRLEFHNIGEMDDVGVDDVGQFKAMAVARHLGEEPMLGITKVKSLAESITTSRSLAAVKRCEVLICCVDNPIARLTSCFVAKLYLKPFLDIGTAVLGGTNSSPGERRIGADVRFLMPDRCILCFGGLAGPQVREHPRLMDSQVQNHADHWRRQRAGSLRSLNQVATGLGLRLLEEFTQGHLRSSVWLQLNTSEHGIPLLSERIANPMQLSCPLCRLAGRGDDGLHLLPSIVRGSR